ncbi:MAG TPA: hypothetical protein VIN73_03060 [Vicingaceae bacterium]
MKKIIIISHVLVLFLFVGCSNKEKKIIGEWQGLDTNEFFVKSNFFMRFNGELYQTQITGSAPESYPYFIKDNIVLIDREGWGDDRSKWNKEFKIVTISDNKIDIKIYNNDELLEGVFSLIKIKNEVEISKDDDMKYMFNKLKEKYQ